MSIEESFEFEVEQMLSGLEADAFTPPSLPSLETEEGEKIILAIYLTVIRTINTVARQFRDMDQPDKAAGCEILALSLQEGAEHHSFWPAMRDSVTHYQGEDDFTNLYRALKKIAAERPIDD